MPVSETELSTGVMRWALRVLRLNCLTNAYADLWHKLYRSVWGAEIWVCSLAEAESARDRSAATGQWDIPLRTEYARRAALVEIDSWSRCGLASILTSSCCLRVSVRRLLVTRKRCTSTRTAGRSPANYNAFGPVRLRSTGSSSSYLEDPAANPVPDGYTAPFYKADRVAEYRQAHAVFAERLRGAQEGGRHEV